MRDFKGAPAVHFNFPLLSFSLYTTFKTGIADASEPIPLEYVRLGECMRHFIVRPYVGLLSGHVSPVPQAVLAWRPGHLGNRESGQVSN